jgi:hypothetical protein
MKYSSRDVLAKVGQQPVMVVLDRWAGKAMQCFKKLRVFNVDIGIVVSARKLKEMSSGCLHRNGLPTQVLLSTMRVALSFVDSFAF